MGMKGFALAIAGFLLVACATPNPVRPRPPGDAAKHPTSTSLAVGRVGGVELDARDFLARLWVRSGDAARGVLEQLVLTELARREAVRLGLEVDRTRVAELLAESEAALVARLAEAGAGVGSLDEHVRGTLGMDPGFYRAQLETDAVVQLTAERCVRAHTLSSERVRVRVFDVEQGAAPAVAAALAAGEPLEAVAGRHGGAETLELLRAESNDLARLAFATAPGEVGGPLEVEGRVLWLEARERLAPHPVFEGSAGSPDWARLGPAVEASLAGEPVGDREFVQWRHRMVERYAVDLSPFLELVGDPGP